VKDDLIAKVDELSRWVTNGLLCSVLLPIQEEIKTQITFPGDLSSFHLGFMADEAHTLIEINEAFKVM